MALQLKPKRHCGIIFRKFDCSLMIRTDSDEADICTTHWREVGLRFLAFEGTWGGVQWFTVRVYASLQFSSHYNSYLTVYYPSVWPPIINFLDKKLWHGPNHYAQNNWSLFFLIFVTGYLNTVCQHNYVQRISSIMHVLKCRICPSIA